MHQLQHPSSDCLDNFIYVFHSQSYKKLLSKFLSVQITNCVKGKLPWVGKGQNFFQKKVDITSTIQEIQDWEEIRRDEM